MALLSLDRHDVLETIRQSNSLHEAFLQVAKLPAVGEYRTVTNADRIRAMSDEELADKFEEIQLNAIKAYENDYLLLKGELKKYWLNWLKQEAEE